MIDSLTNEEKLLVDAIVGTRERIREMLILKGFSDPTADKIIDKIEVIIAYSGLLASMLEKDRIYDEIMNYKNELRVLRKKLRC